MEKFAKLKLVLRNSITSLSTNKIWQTLYLHESNWIIYKTVIVLHKRKCHEFKFKARILKFSFPKHLMKGPLNKHLICTDKQMELSWSSFEEFVSIFVTSANTNSASRNSCCQVDKQWKWRKKQVIKISCNINAKADSLSF